MKFTFDGSVDDLLKLFNIGDDVMASVAEILDTVHAMDVKLDAVIQLVQDLRNAGGVATQADLDNIMAALQAMKNKEDAIQ